MTDTEQRLEAIESKLAYSEDLVQQLNDALSRQQLHITRLEESLRLLAERLNEARQDSGAERGTHELPPHY